MNEQRVIGQFEALKTTGSIELSIRRGRLIFLFLLTLVFALFGLAMMFAAYGQASSVGDMLTTGSFWIGLLVVVFFGVFGIPSLLMQIVQNRKLVLDRRGFRYGKPYVVGTDPELEIRWDEILTLGLAQISRSTMVAMQLTPEGYERYRSRLGSTSKRLAGANERIMGQDMMALPAHVGHGPKELMTLMALAHGEFGPPEVRERQAALQTEAEADYRSQRDSQQEPQQYRSDRQE